MTQPVSVTTAKDTFKSELAEILSARYPLVHIPTHEEDRTLRAISEVCADRAKTMLVWSTSQGIFTLDHHKRTVERGDLADLAAALAYFEKTAAKHEQDLVLVLLDPQPYLNQPGANPIYRRRLRDLAADIRTRGYPATCILLSPEMQTAPELEKELTVLDFPLPDRAEVAEFIGNFIQSVQKLEFGAAERPDELVEALVEASLGLTMIEIENAIARAIVDDGRLDFNDVERIFSQKKQIIRKSGILEYYDTRGLSLDEVGGLNALKDWLGVRSVAFSAQAESFGIQPPKGVLLTGVPGCGKSFAAKCAAASWRLPLIRLDMGKVYSSLVGSSEQHMREVIATCESMAPCILWLDEIEKALPRSSGHVGDNGVSLRVLGSFLTWLEEKTSPVFVFATANQISLLPPELLRKGRFDEVFFVDLPDAAERQEIIKIHLRRAKRDPGDYDLDRLTALTGPETLGTGAVLTGAEIAAWVNETLIHAFYRASRQGGPRDMTMADLEAVAESLVPIARLRREEIEQMRRWADSHALKASTVADSSAEKTGRDLDIADAAAG